MHLLVPGAYRPSRVRRWGVGPVFVSMHLLVPGAYRLDGTFPGDAGPAPVSMHLLVPGAYRRAETLIKVTPQYKGLNAPSGAGCLPTKIQHLFVQVLAVSMHLLVPGAYRPSPCRCHHAPSSLNAPSGAGCLPTREDDKTLSVRIRSQCTFWCRVLTDFAGES